jgi:hypothetical protein
VRRTLILEFWVGEARTCPHRCEQHWGPCNYSPATKRQLASVDTGDGASEEAGGVGKKTGAGSEDHKEDHKRSIASSWSRFDRAVRAEKPWLALMQEGDGKEGNEDASSPVSPWLRVMPPSPGMPQPDDLADGLDALMERYPLSPAQVESFRCNRYIRLKDVLPAAVLAAARAELVSIVTPAMAHGHNISLPADPTVRANV